MQRGEVWWADLLLPSGRRPVVLLSRNAVYRIKDSCTIGPITRTIRGIPSEVRLGPEDGLSSECVVNLDNIMTIPRAQFIRRIAALSADKINAVDLAIIFALGLGE
ncbi:MAG: type II toxin-antitoxin system PemK/MazF family toxin [Dehalococcoidia bacterium]|nr:type II toxin-antitoxin system PemK/MazF family toxin [Dehalococcoidia bacterium]